MTRRDRNFELTISAPGATIVVNPPRRIAFTCDKSVTGGLNRLSLNVWDLKSANRLAVVKDAEEEKRIPLVLRVGYGDNIETIFQGTVLRASNDREGPSFISSFECLDGGFDYLNGFTNRTVKGKDVAITELLKDLPNLSVGKITEQPQLTRPKVLVGNPLQILQKSLRQDETWYIDNEQLFIIRDDEVVSRYVPRVEAKTGLLNTPQRQQQKVSFETLMNPALKLGGKCELVSTVAPHLNGVYKIESMSYSGDNRGADWKQAVTCIAASGFKNL